MPYPYTVTIQGLINTLHQLRSAFPNKLTADSLKKWGLAPNNETYVLNVLRFLGLIDNEGGKHADAAKVFLEHEEVGFAAKFETLVRSAYAGLFDHFGEEAWTLGRDRLIGFFRTEDETSATVGSRQANTFVALAGLAGHGAAPAEGRTPATGSTRRRPTASPPSRARGSSGGNDKGAPPAGTYAPVVTPASKSGSTSPSLSVRIEVNLPVTEDQSIYDKIFRSIRANLIDGRSSSKS